MSQPVNGISFINKDECPEPDLFQGSKPNSIIIAEFEFSGLRFRQEGPTSFLGILRNQFPLGKVIIKLPITNVKEQPRTTKMYIEIGFEDEYSRDQALSKPFSVQKRLIKMHKTILLSNRKVYKVYIENIEQIGFPVSYKGEVRTYLKKFGDVEDVHLHYTRDGNWFTGEGCAIIAISSDKIQQIQQHPKLTFMFTEYPINGQFFRYDSPNVK
ncbi:hypothetical protein BD408DRAFT_429834 [Parasitella parasitica]|nr:hypothetical protein BD408DRAFT_429834 [Parasitella parasitica]